MHVAVCFINIGFYHAARLRAASEACAALGWKLTAVQLTADTLEHPWGNADRSCDFDVVTLLASGAPAVAGGLPRIARSVVERCFDTLQPTVVFVPGWSFEMCDKVLSWCRVRRVPAVLMSESKRDDAPRTWWKEWLKARFCIPKFRAAVVGGRMHADYLESLGLERGRVFTGYDAVDNAHFAAAADYARAHEAQVRAEFPALPSGPYFIAVLRLIARKNVKRLLAAYVEYRARAEGRPWDLVLCGEGAERPALEAIIENGGLRDCVHMPGFLPYGQVGCWYAFAGALVHPALIEPWGLVVNEACAAGLPLLCSRTVGARYDLLHEGENGWSFDPESTEEITECLLRMHALDPAERQRMSDASRRVVASFSPAAFGAAVVSAARTATASDGARV